jgi:hypothetical protein
MEYAQARIQARFGERPGASAWRELEALAGLSAFLDAARATGLGRWLARIDERSDSHAVEIALRESLRSAVREIAGWMPARWRAALAWTLHLVDLPALLHLARGQPPLPWMAQDPVLRRYAATGAEERRAVLEADFGSLLLPAEGLRRKGRQKANGEEDRLRATWLRRWMALWPEAGEEERASVLGVARCIERDLESSPQSSAERDAPQRSALEDRLRHLLRGSTLLPAAAFAYLAIAALDVERLRAGLLTRALFPPVPGEP